MHELGATQNVVESIVAICAERDISTVHSVELEIGQLTTYEKDPFCYYYDLLKVKHDCLKDSTLDVSIASGKVQCLDCQKESLISTALELCCSACKSINVKLIAGQDVIIKNLKI